MTTLSEVASKALLGKHGIPLLAEALVTTPDAGAAAADEMGYPVVAKLVGDNVAHKTERGLVKLRLGDAAAVRLATEELLAAGRPDDEVRGVLVAPMLSGHRELIAGLVQDSQFGMTVMLGVGGVLAEVVADVVFRLVPLTRTDAEDLINDLSTQSFLGEFRGEPAVDRAALVDILLCLSAAAEHDPSIVAADLNPLIIVDGRPVAVDALVEIA